jgi:enoyl-CoA hydratase/carnithine racemase
MRVAEAQARFCQPEINLGLTTGIGGCSRLARLVGRGAAGEMVLTGRPMSARRLYELGAINRVVAAGEAVGSAVALGLELADKSWGALQGLKKMLHASDTLPLDEALVNEQSVFQAVAVTPDARAAIKAIQQQYDQGASVAQVNGYHKYQAD